MGIKNTNNNINYTTNNNENNTNNKNNKNTWDNMNFTTNTSPSSRIITEASPSPLTEAAPIVCHPRVLTYGSEDAAPEELTITDHDDNGSHDSHDTIPFDTQLSVEEVEMFLKNNIPERDSDSEIILKQDEDNKVSDTEDEGLKTEDEMKRENEISISNVTLERVIVTDLKLNMRDEFERESDED